MSLAFAVDTPPRVSRRHAPAPNPTRGHRWPFALGRTSLLSYDHSQVALEVELATAPKCLLLVMAARACPGCGLTWLGTRRLTRETGLGETSLRKALRELTDLGHITIHAYPKGGRGRATEYVVLPQVLRLSTAPCGECRARMANPSRGEGFEKEGTENPARGEGYRRNPARKGVKTPRTGTDQQSVQPNSHSTGSPVQRVLTDTSGPRPTASGSAAPPTPDPPSPRPTPPRNAQEALAAVNAMTQGLQTHMGMFVPRRANSGTQEGGKAPTTAPEKPTGKTTEP